MTCVSCEGGRLRQDGHPDLLVCTDCICVYVRTANGLQLIHRYSFDERCAHLLLSEYFGGGDNRAFLKLVNHVWELLDGAA